MAPTQKRTGKRVTMKDIAQKTGYSINTVSHALNNKTDITPETKEYIIETARKIGYIGNALASSMRSGFTRTVAIIISDITNPFFAIMVKLIEQELRKNKYTILTMNTGEDIEIERECVLDAIRKNVDGIIICPTQQNNESINLMKNNNIPFVLMGRYFKGHKYESVLVDDFYCGYLAAEHLIDLGHERILFLNGPAYISSSQERQSGYEKALEQAGLPVRSELIHVVDITSHNCEELILHTLNRDIAYTAVITFSDIIAWEVIYVLTNNGLCIPSDLSLVSIDNVQSHIHYPFPLTSVDIPKESMAKLIVRSLFRLIHEGFATTVKNTLTPELVKRNSTRPLSVSGAQSRQLP